jgi:hypothetical protein
VTPENPESLKRKFVGGLNQGERCGAIAQLIESAKIPRSKGRELIHWHVLKVKQKLGQHPHELQSRKTGPLINFWSGETLLDMRYFVQSPDRSLDFGRDDLVLFDLLV